MQSHSTFRATTGEELIPCNAYRAPEQTDEEEFGRRGSHTDAWGFAATVLHLVTGQVPYSSFTPMQIMGAMTKRRPPAVPDTLPPWLQNILRQCLSFDAAARPSVLQLLQVSVRFSSRHTLMLDDSVIALEYIDCSTTIL